jgi:lysophospholipase L1-like esterase
MPNRKTLLRALTIAAPLAACGLALSLYAQSPTPAELAHLHQLASNFAQLDRYAAANAALPPAQKGRVVFFGDSITDAWSNGKHTFFPGKPYIGRGISGQTTAQMLIRFRSDVIDLHPDAVVILAGTNDIAGNTGDVTQQQIADNFISMAELARANHIRVIFSSVLPAADFSWRKGRNPAPKIRALNDWIQQYCKDQHHTYLDYYSALTDADGGMKPGTSSDGVHPTDQGYAIMSPLAEAAITKAEKQKP